MSTSAFHTALSLVTPVSESARTEALAYHDRLTKPRGALGQLETVGAQLSAIAGEVPPPLPSPVAIAVFAGDHGVLAEGVSPWPKEVTAQMVANFATGGAAINVLARQVGASVTVVDVGVDADLSAFPDVVSNKVGPGTANLAIGPAMTTDEALRALDCGAETAAKLVGKGARCLVTGDMGIGNTTPSACLIAAFSGSSAVDVTGRGTGIDDATLALKQRVVGDAVSRVTSASSPLEILAEVGGFEIAALAGFIIGGAAAGIPVVIDGVIATAAACTAHAFSPDAIGYVVAGHRSTEPGATVALTHLGLHPLIDMGLRLGEGSGACLAVPAVQAAALIMREMATFDSAGVVDKHA